MKKLILLSLLVLFGCSKDSDSGDFLSKTQGKYFVDARSVNADLPTTITKFNQQYFFQQMSFNSQSPSCGIGSFYTSVTITKNDSNTLEGIGELTLNRGTEIFKAQITGTNPLTITTDFGTWVEISRQNFTFDVKLKWRDLSQTYHCGDRTNCQHTTCQRSF